MTSTGETTQESLQVAERENFEHQNRVKDAAPVLNESNITRGFREDDRSLPAQPSHLQSVSRLSGQIPTEDLAYSEALDAFHRSSLVEEATREEFLLNASRIQQQWASRKIAAISLQDLLISRMFF